MNSIDDIEDPSDFKCTQVPQLLEIDSLLRCHVCKEFLVAPVLTSCGHSFCSLCIRKYLINKPHCPICSQEIRESNLTKNVLLEQILLSYKGLRKDLLKVVQVQKEKRSEYSDSPENDLMELQTRNTFSEKDDEDDVIIIDETKKRKSDISSIDSLLKKQKKEALVACPICLKEMSIIELQGCHIDECLSSPSSTKSLLEVFEPKEPPNPFKKLTKLNFSSISTSTLKGKLAKLEIPTNGTRNQLESRYNEYLVLWNANCDSLVPRDPRVLRKQLAQWEGSLKIKNGKSHKQLDKSEWSHLISKAKESSFKSKPESEYRNEKLNTTKAFFQD